tara:strand:- start:54 stop:749 length:696 start_codon:yes stop_codon:yes gene_type:complete
MINIKETFKNINSDLHISDISSFDEEKIKKAISTFKKNDNIVLYCEVNENNTNFFEQTYNILNYLKSIRFSSEHNNIMNRIKRLSEELYKIKRRKDVAIVNDNSNINELNVDYYNDKINESKLKRPKFTVDIIDEPVDLTKILTSEYIEECKATLKKVEKTEKIQHILDKKTELDKFKPLDVNYKGLIYYKGLIDLYYDYSTSEDIKKMYEDLIERSNNLNSEVKENNDNK